MGSRGAALSPHLIAELEAAVESLAAEDISYLPSDAVGEDIIHLHRIIERLQAQTCRRLAHFDRLHGFAAHGFLSAAAWLGHHCRLLRTTAYKYVRVSQQLEDLPHTRQAFTDGDLSFAHAAVMSTAVEQIGIEPVLACEHDLVQAARHLDPRDLTGLTQYLRHHVDQQGVLEDAKESRSRRWCYFAETLDGVFYLNARLDAEGGQILKTALEAHMPPPSGDDLRSARQRRADALVEIAEHDLNSGDLPRSGGERPHIELTVTLETLRCQPSAEPARLNGALIPNQTARRITCDGTLIPILVDAEGSVLDVGRSKRTITPAQRRAMNRRDGRCRFPGCDRPTRWCEAHHLEHWADGGPTVLWNLLSFCKRHHIMVHDYGGQVVLHTDGGVQISWPEGTVLPP